MIISTNKTSYPDTLIVILDQDKGRSKFTEKDQVTRVENEDGEVIGFNFFNVSSFLDYDKLPNGEVKPTQELVDALNKKIAEAGFDTKLEIGKPTLVYGYVKTCEAHPDSDHLHVTTVDVGNGEEHQIVCGAPNIAQGQMVVVAALRGVDSYGMICSARELGLAHAPQKRGIMVVPDDFKAGDEFEPTKCDELLASGQISL